MRVQWRKALKTSVTAQRSHTSSPWSRGARASASREASPAPSASARGHKSLFVSKRPCKPDAQAHMSIHEMRMEQGLHKLSSDQVVVLPLCSPPIGFVAEQKLKPQALKVLSSVFFFLFCFFKAAIIDSAHEGSEELKEPLLTVFPPPGVDTGRVFIWSCVSGRLSANQSLCGSSLVCEAPERRLFSS